IAAKKAVVAAGYESGAYLRDAPVRLKSTYAIATQPINDWPHRDLLIWETARPYIYLRSTPDGRIMLGGEDEDFRDPRRRDRLIGRKMQRLERKLEALFPRLETRTDYSW